MSLRKTGSNRVRTLAIIAFPIGLLCFAVVFWLRNSATHEAGTPPSQEMQAADASAGVAAADEPQVAAAADSVAAPALPGATNQRALAPSNAVAPQSRLAPSAEEAKTEPEVEKESPEPAKEVRMQRGKAVFRMTCFACHQPDGRGVSDQVPPLAQSDFLMTNLVGSIRNVLLGCTGELTVNGKTYKGTMLPLYSLSDDSIASVVTFARNSWGNSADAVTAAEVRKIRQETGPPPMRSE